MSKKPVWAGIMRPEYYEPVREQWALDYTLKENPGVFGMKQSPPATEATYAACLLHCGPHERGKIGDSVQFNAYYNRIYAWYRESYFDWSSGQWIEFYNEYFKWVEGHDS